MSTDEQYYGRLVPIEADGSVRLSAHPDPAFGEWYRRLRRGYQQRMRQMQREIKGGRHADEAKTAAYEEGFTARQCGDLQILTTPWGRIEQRPVPPGVVGFGEGQMMDVSIYINEGPDME